MATIQIAFLTIRTHFRVRSWAKAMRRRSTISSIALILLADVNPGGANPTVIWYSVGGGGGVATGGSYTVQGTVGQSLAGEPVAGGEFHLQAGFWAALIVESPGEVPTLKIELIGDSVSVSWSPASAGFVLEQNSSLTATPWAAAPIGNPATIPLSSGQTFFRLREH